jgi:hypothetical protein
MPHLQEVADRLAIRDLVERYTVSVTRRDWNAMGQCFHEQSRWRTSPPFNHDFQTRKGIQDGISGAVSTSDFLVQMTHGVIIDELTADRCKATVVLNEMGRRSGQKTGLFLLGVYHDTITKIDGRWGFEDRYFEAYYVDTAWLPGNVVVNYETRR